jgi:hypothetical protein
MIVDFASVLGHRPAIFLMLIRFLQEGHSTVVFSSGMIRKLGIATGFQQNAQVATLSSRGESGSGVALQQTASGVLWAGCGFPQRQTSLNGSGDIAV